MGQDQVQSGSGHNIRKKKKLKKDNSYKPLPIETGCFECVRLGSSGFKISFVLTQDVCSDDIHCV